MSFNWIPIFCKDFFSEFVCRYLLRYYHHRLNIKKRGMDLTLWDLANLKLVLSSVDI